jgi:multiple sugar transport system ATP-binding protein
MSIVKLVNVAYTIKQQIIIEPLSLHIPEGEFWVLVGPSGCGKSTVLRMIAGLEKPTEGEIYFDDRLMNSIEPSDRDVAMVFQNYALYPHLTIGENLGFGLKMRGVNSTIIQQKVTAIAHRLNINYLLTRKPYQLSGGQQQRVALGRALIREPKVFLLDEPLSNLDAQLRDDLRAEIKELHQQVKITTIYVTHDQLEATTLADKIVVLYRGKVQQIGTPREVYGSPNNQMVATFIGNPPMNIIPAIYQQDSWQIGNQFIKCDSGIRHQLNLHNGQGYNLGIRPECLSTDHQEIELVTTIRLIESLMRETILRLNIPGTDINIIAAIRGNHTYAIGDRLSLFFNPQDLFIFDPIDGKKLFGGC